VSKLANGKLKYQIQWVGHDEDLEWYPASDIKYAPHKLQDFHKQNPDQPEPPRNLQKWQAAWENRHEDYDELDNDKPLPTHLRASFFQKGG
jgi:hypothetical protein